jgi:hypothetical protein
MELQEYTGAIPILLYFQADYPSEEWCDHIPRKIVIPQFMIINLGLPSLCIFFPNGKTEVLHPYRTVGKIIIVYILSRFYPIFQHFHTQVAAIIF